MQVRRLSLGERMKMEIIAALLHNPKIVFLDEVGAGVNRTLLKKIANAIHRLNQEQGYTFCMIEHDMDFINHLCDPVIVMAEGSILATGTSEEIMSNESVIEAYLGAGHKTRKA